MMLKFYVQYGRCNNMLVQNLHSANLTYVCHAGLVVYVLTILKYFVI
jgi:hypothetical protein